MNSLQVFKFDHLNVRVVTINGEPWWFAMDVAGILGYSDTQAMTRRLDNGEVIGYTDNSSGQGRNITIINESGLYGSILGSNKPEAKAFKRWVTSEVLPQIRKTGSYSLKVPKTLPEALRAYADEVEAHEKSKAFINVQSEIIAAQQPKVEGWDNFIGCDGLVELNHVAQICKTGRNTLFRKLRDEKVFYYKGAYNSVYQQYVDAGYFEMRMVPNEELGPIPVIKCTPKGAEWIYNKFYRRVAA